MLLNLVKNVVASKQLQTITSEQHHRRRPYDAAPAQRPALPAGRHRDDKLLFCPRLLPERSVHRRRVSPVATARAALCQILLPPQLPRRWQR